MEIMRSMKRRLWTEMEIGGSSITTQLEVDGNSAMVKNGLFQVSLWWDQLFRSPIDQVRHQIIWNDNLFISLFDSFKYFHINIFRIRPFKARNNRSRDRNLWHNHRWLYLSQTVIRILYVKSLLLKIQQLLRFNLISQLLIHITFPFPDFKKIRNKYEKI